MRFVSTVLELLAWSKLTVRCFSILGAVFGRLFRLALIESEFASQALAILLKRQLNSLLVLPTPTRCLPDPDYLDSAVPGRLYA
jgi:hypothetical protein